MESRVHEVVCKGGWQFTVSPDEVGTVLVQRVMEDGSLSRGQLEPMFGWDLAEFVEDWDRLRGMRESDVLSDMLAAQWTETEDDRWEAFEDYLGGLSR